MLELFIIILIGLGAVAFVTLLERKILGLSQIRLGPNKVTIRGILQPLADGVKLLAKQMLSPKRKQLGIFLIIPSLLLLIFLLLWCYDMEWEGNLEAVKYTRLVLFSLLGVGAYSVILTGWASTRVFSKLGRLRGILQRISYEVTLILVFIIILFPLKRIHFSSMSINKEIRAIWMTLWFLLILIERNRAPFDLLEGESELISGFNVEIGSLVFVLLFLSEYGILLFLRLVLAVIITRVPSLIACICVFFLLLIRRCFPRLRYDSLITLIWQSFLPLRLFLRFPGLWL